MKYIFLILTFYLYGCTSEEYTEQELLCAQSLVKSFHMNDIGEFSVGEGIVSNKDLKKIIVHLSSIESCKSAQTPKHISADSNGFRLIYGGSVDDDWGLYITNNGLIEINDIKSLEWLGSGIYKYSTVP